MVSKQFTLSQAQIPPVCGRFFFVAELADRGGDRRTWGIFGGVCALPSLQGAVLCRHLVQRVLYATTVAVS